MDWYDIIQSRIFLFTVISLGLIQVREQFVLNGRAGFQFKQFSICHDVCGMKVGTDSILLGSWVQPQPEDRILDVGTGSGLLAIMLAQKACSATQITGIDIEASAIQQARENASRCPWHSQLTFVHQPHQLINVDHRFDLIVSNPPYYPAGQKLNPKRQQARHTHTLLHGELLEGVVSLLSPGGRFALVLPEQFCSSLIQLAKGQGLHLHYCLNIRTTPDKRVRRRLLFFSFSEATADCHELVIHEQSGEYTEEYKTLTRDYYLNF